LLDSLLQERSERRTTTTGKIEGNVFERNSLGSDEAEEEGCEASLD